MQPSPPPNKLLPYSYAKRYQVIADYDNDLLTLYHLDALSLSVLAEVQRHLEQPVTPVRVNPIEFRERLTSAYEERAGSAESLAESIASEAPLEDVFTQALSTVDLLDQADEAPIIRLINALLTEAIGRNASDIHIEPFEEDIVIRMRVDGVLQAVLHPPQKLAAFLISRIKVMARLDIAEKRIPQDGRISTRLGKHFVDIRVSTIPTLYGERVVLRLLDKTRSVLDFPSLGLPTADEERLKAALDQPHGMMLVTGPTGSGKTTTLYTALSYLNDGSRNILTVEDPVEYELSGIGQTQVNNKSGMSFARGLRAILRQDPDIVMIGEIRDRETADIAVQASLTGHLVLSTLHTNTALGAITRLVDMGVEPFLLSSTIKALIAQRLVRRLCGHCKEPASPDPALLARLGYSTENTTGFYQPKGCPQCHGTGYQGRMAVYEVITIDADLQACIHNGESEQAMTAIARQQCLSLKDAAIQQLQAGRTSLDEVLRVTFG